jgi:hypothetical protein
VKACIIRRFRRERVKGMRKGSAVRRVGRRCGRKEKTGSRRGRGECMEKGRGSERKSRVERRLAKKKGLGWKDGKGKGMGKGGAMKGRGGCGEGERVVEKRIQEGRGRRD